MERLIWSDKLNTGIQVIDRQHRRLVDLINRLYYAHSGGSSKDEVGRVLDELIDYTRTHFAFEEAMLEDVNYADLAAHKAIHARFFNQIEALRAHHIQKEASSVELNNLMVTWLINHIMSEDAAYVPAVTATY
jgi:hemerythrin